MKTKKLWISVIAFIMMVMVAFGFGVTLNVADAAENSVWGDWTKTTTSGNPFAGNNANQSTGTDETYGNYIEVSDTSDAVYFYTPWITDRTEYEKLGVYVYNCGTTDVSGYYNDWTAGSYNVNFTLKAGEWTLITFADHYITCGNNYLYINGTFRFTDVYGLKSGAGVWNGWTKTTTSGDWFVGDNSLKGADITYGDYIQADSVSDGYVTFFAPRVTDKTNYDKLGVYVYNCGTTDVSGYYNDWEAGNYSVNFTLKAGEWTLLTFTDHYITTNKNNYLYMTGTFRFTEVYGITFGDEVKMQIDELPNASELTSITAKDLQAIEAAKTAYDALSETNKAKVTNYDKLTALLTMTADYKVLLNADDVTKLGKGTNTGKQSTTTIGTAVDETYGNVWTLTTTSDTTDFFPATTLTATGYKKVEFYVYNPTNNDISIVWYDSLWNNLQTISTVANSWTKFSLAAENFADTFFMFAQGEDLTGTWKITSFIGNNEADPVAAAVKASIAELPAAASVTSDASYVKYLFKVNEIEEAYAALTDAQKAEVTNYADLTALRSVLHVKFKVAVDVTAEGNITTGNDSGNFATATAATTDDYYGNALSMTFNAGQASFRTIGLNSVIDTYTSVVFYIYNPTAANDVFYWYYDGWNNGWKTITLNAGEWTEVVVSKEKYTYPTVAHDSTSFFVIDSNAGGGTWKISDIYGVSEGSHITIVDGNGSTLATGDAALTYDGSALNQNGYVFIGFEYEGALYRNVAELQENVNESTYTVTAKTAFVRVVDGASVRITGNSGLRFTADVESGYADYGMIFTGAQLINGEFTKENLDAQSIQYKHVYSTMSGFNSTTNTDGSVRFSIVLQNIKEENYAQLFTARAYVRVTYFDGETDSVYSVYETSKHARSIRQIASMAVADTTVSYTGTQQYVLRKYEGSVAAANKLIDADQWTSESILIRAGSNTGNSSVVGTTTDPVFGTVFTLTISHNEGDANNKLGENNGDFYPSPMDIGANVFVRFYVYNPASTNINLISYSAGWNDWGLAATLQANAWTEVNISCATYGTDPFFIIDSVECFDKEFKITSFYGVEGDNASLLESYVGVEIDETKSFDIMAYGGPASGVIHENRAEYTAQDIYVRYYQTATLADVKKYVDAGYEYWCADDAWYGRSYLNEYANMPYEHDAYWALDMAAAYYQCYGKELPVIVTIDNLASAMKNEKYTTDSEKADYKAWLAQAIADLKSYQPTNGGKNFFAGVQLCDEPIYSYSESYLYWYNYLATDLKLVQDGYILTGALFGMEGNQEQIAGNTGSSSGCTTAQYQTYLNAFTTGKTNQSVLLFDNYPFQVKASVWSSQYLISDSWFENMQIVSQTAKNNGVQAGICIQSMGWEVGDGSSKYYYYTESEANISMQVYAALAYGYTYLNYFVYTQPYNFTDHEDYNQAPVIWDEATQTFSYTDLYNYVSNVNNEVRGFEDVLMSFDYLGTQLVTGSTTGNNFGSATNYTTDLIVNSSKGATYDMAIGYFEKNGAKAYLVANVDNPHNNRTNTATLNLGTDYTKAIVYVDGVATIQTVTNGQLNVSLGRGEGVFVIPVK